MSFRKLILLTTSATIFLWDGCSSQNRDIPSDTRLPTYVVTIHKDDIRKVDVKATLPLISDTIAMSQNEFAPLQNGYATFVHELTAVDRQGNIVGLTNIGKGLWKVNTSVPATILLSYTVTIGHDDVAWTVSAAFARAYAVDNVLFFAGRTVFIAPLDPDTIASEITYRLPDGWSVATPYPEVAGRPATFRAKNRYALWQNGNFVGDFIQKEINVGKLKVIIAGASSMSEGVSLFQDALTKIINAYQLEMDGAPEGKLLIMGSVSPIQSGGETFANSISLMFFRPPDMSDKGRWGYLLAHEVFHLWNGAAIRPAKQSEVEWFAEGFTEYMSKLTAYKTGFTGKAEFLEQLGYIGADYVSRAGKVSLRTAGLQKGRNYELIYNGGMSVALALDIAIHQATKNQKGFIDLMRKMYSEFGKTGMTYTYNDIVSVTSEVAGRDLSDFFSDYVSGTQVIPLAQYFVLTGMEFKGTSITPLKNPTPEAGDLLKSILGR